MFQQQTKTPPNIRFEYPFDYLEVLNSMTHQKIQQKLVTVASP